MDQLSPPLQAGQPWPLGAHWDGAGINFAVFSANAQSLVLCLFDTSGTVELAQLALPRRTGDVWHGYLVGGQVGQIYGLRAHGPWAPHLGHRFNPHKLLLDPYAREVVGHFAWKDEHFAGSRNDRNTMDTRDNGAHALKARVVHDRFDWGNDKAPLHASEDTVLYELHVKGFSRLNPLLPPALRGTYAGLAHEASIAHLKRLGVNSISLLPVHHALDEERLVALGLGNYWGYNTLAFFCPATRLAAGADGLNPRDEFRAMVKALHAQGFAVLLDVVFNHTAETDETGPNLSFRGLDNASYYRLRADDPSLYENHAGCGNTLDIRRPCVLQLVMDSLRYWVSDMHVDGFRFDLAPILGRGDHGFDRNGAFFTAIAQDPVLSRVKMVAEPWDIGPGGYQLGQFPNGWLEWNDQFRDTMRSFWLEQGPSACTRGEFAMRLCGSADRFQTRQRRPVESVNYVVSHDGFTLRDLVSYNERHNLANGEENRDGAGHGSNRNCGVEGPTDNEMVNTLRERLQRALLATTLLAQGTPMLCAGDELGHSQRGNNNPYCQDNPTTWLDWKQAEQPLCDFTARVLALRRQLLPLGPDWYRGEPAPSGQPDLQWLRGDGRALDGAAWNDRDDRVLGCLINRPGRATAPVLLLVNPHAQDCLFTLPTGPWNAVLDTSAPQGLAGPWQEPSHYPLAAHGLALLVRMSLPPNTASPTP